MTSGFSIRYDTLVDDKKKNDEKRWRFKSKKSNFYLAWVDQKRMMQVAKTLIILQKTQKVAWLTTTKI